MLINKYSSKIFCHYFYEYEEQGVCFKVTTIEQYTCTESKCAVNAVGPSRL